MQLGYSFRSIKKEYEAIKWVKENESKDLKEKQLL